MSCSAGVERWPAALALALALALAGGAAMARESGDEQTAETLFQAGRALVAQGRIDDACPMFARSVQIGASVGGLVNLARCHEMQGKTASAWREYRDAAALASSEGDDERAAAANEYAAKLAPRLSHLTLRAPAGVVVYLDGAELPAGDRGRARPIDPGEHRIVARGDGVEWSTTVTVEADGDRQVVTVPRPRRPAPPPREPGPEWRRPFGIALASVGAASMIAGAVLGIIVLDEASEAESDPTLCPDKLCSAEGEAFIETSRDKAMAASLTLGLGAAAAIAGGIVFFTAPSAESGARVVPLLSPTAIGLSVTDRF
jgi:hypothetical protein